MVAFSGPPLGQVSWFLPTKYEPKRDLHEGRKGGDGSKIEIATIHLTRCSS